jgi:succinoglycan biosynthesis protein ExoM
LGRALDSLAAMVRPKGAIFFVIDNDGKDPEVERRVRAFEASCGARAKYIVEPTPGISAARNAAFAAARSVGAQAIAMLDDDEWVSSNWLMELIETRKSTSAGVVGGPVRPVFAAHGRNLMRYAELWSVRPGRLKGRVHVYCTCNCLIDVPSAAFLGDRPFPAEFGLSGGEDSVFFRRLLFAGVEMAWCEDAVIFEHVGADRANIAWMRRRWYRQGNVGVRCERAAPGPGDGPPWLKTALLCARLPIYPLLNRKVFAAPLLWLFETDRIRGRIACHFGSVVTQYERPITGLEQ